ncbi:hypothetical protein AVEN_267391-1, partial [Araneus ventricosus]
MIDKLNADIEDNTPKYQLTRLAVPTISSAGVTIWLDLF